MLKIMTDGLRKNLQFGPFELSSRERALRRDGVVLPLGDRALDILIYLAERPACAACHQQRWRAIQDKTANSYLIEIAI